ncbi:thioesterase family protein [Tropicimonas sp. S265A]|uniref:thioesterase family protein n=1 Tax=Tropicimonas sp. S265A TaxID=3415134 RepID=UPI003C7DC5EC
MYPFFRLALEVVIHRKSRALGPMDTHVSFHRCWPWDLDVFAELNNGRTLTIYDLGRLPFGMRAGLFRVLRKNAWGLTMAGAAVRYRRRIRLFDRIEMRSRVIGWDARFMYVEQSMSVRGQVAGHIVYRSAVTDAEGLVPPQRVADQIAPGLHTPALPDWVKAWVEAEDLRPWPPEIAT